MRNSKEVLCKAIINLGDRLQLSRGELANIIGISETTLSHIYDGKAYIEPESKEGELAALLLHIYERVSSLFGGNEEQCRLWLRSSNKYFQGKPIEIAQQEKGLVSVVSYLDSV